MRAPLFREAPLPASHLWTLRALLGFRLGVLFIGCIVNQVKATTVITYFVYESEIFSLHLGTAHLRSSRSDGAAYLGLEEPPQHGPLPGRVGASRTHPQGGLGFLRSW